MSDLKIKAEVLDKEIVLVEAEGYLDAHTFEDLEGILQGLFQKDLYRIIVNLEKLDYISSAGCGVFIGAIGTAQEEGGNVVLLRPSESVREVFDLLGLTQIFPLVEDLGDAKDVFNESSVI